MLYLIHAIQGSEPSERTKILTTQQKESHIEFCLIFCSRFIFVKDALNTNFFPNLKIKKFTSQNILCRLDIFNNFSTPRFKNPN